MNLSDLARATDCSISTVSKVLSHKGEITTKTREKILRMAHQMGLDTPKSKDAGDLYIILPQIPKYYWNTLYQHILNTLAQTNIRATFHFATKHVDRFTARYYLEDAMRTHARAILIAAEIDESICEVAQRCMAQCPVFSVGDICEASCAFHFGAEPYLVGVRMAEMLNSDMGGGHIAIAKTNRFSQGVEGFLSAFRGTSTLLSFSDCFHSASSAIFARTLSTAHEAHPFDAIVCLDGFADRLCLTMQKLKLEIPCYGLEHAPRMDPYLASGVLRGTLCNDLAATAYCAISAISAYLQDGTLPRTRNTHIEPILLRSTKK